ncbi:hypothetical protein PYCCODRAFT_1436921 [Trametes coccinea BRFM310]|uniref:F-box domain-containing protein n=1 Tax=Trametes coccinea (strain BRFM310) TaxID=1353009 RepID=A0A1Y2IIA3_TRAC3|nr:hypothetical protein PYCCODRAFT_1436921 [Trametes coccinea BRFM310]
MSTLQSIPPEIFATICADCDPRTLLSLAHACRGLSWLALALLWQKTDSLSALLHILPSDAIQRSSPYLHHPTGKVVRIVDVGRELTSKDLERYRVYAPLIHSLNLFAPLGWDVTANAWKRFERADPGPLPNLRNLSANMHIDGRDPTGLIIPVYVLLGAAFEDLAISVRTSAAWNPQEKLEPYISDLLMRLAKRCPQFSRLNLSLDQEAPYLSGVLADALCGLPGLVSLRIINIPLLPRAFVQIGSLSSLTTLEFDARSADYPQGALTRGHSGDGDPFPSLATLEICADSMQCLISLIEYARAPRLEYLKITLHFKATSPELTKLTATIGSSPFHATLERLGLNIPYGVETADRPLPPHLFEPLYAISHLRSFYLKGFCYAALDDAAFVQMARAWPHLENLQLCDMRPPPGTITLAGLVELARLCGSIQSLRLQLADVHNAQCVALLERLRSGSAVAQPTVGMRRQTRLDIGNPTIGDEDVSAVSEILARALPPLDRLIHSWGPEVSGVNKLDQGASEVLPEPTSLREVMARKWTAVRTSYYSARQTEPEQGRSSMIVT